MRQRIEAQIEKLRSLGNTISESSKNELIQLLRDLRDTIPSDATHTAE